MKARLSLNSPTNVSPPRNSCRSVHRSADGLWVAFAAISCTSFSSIRTSALRSTIGKMVAPFVAGAFRVDAALAGPTAEVEPLVDELCRFKLEFKAPKSGIHSPSGAHAVCR